MNIVFNIAYNTEFGEDLTLNIINKSSEETQYRMRTGDGKLWTCNLQLDVSADSHICYYYSVVRGENNVIRKEWTVMPHRFDANMTKDARITLYDRWNVMPEDSYLYSSAFTDCLRRRRMGLAHFLGKGAMLRVKVRAPQLRSNERLWLVGSDTALGAWNPRKGIAMYEHNYNEWVADIDLRTLRVRTFEFKFVAIDVPTGKEIIWEDRYNRKMTLPEVGDDEVMVVEQETALFAICNVKCAGTLVPVFSLRTETDFGVGDFGDLKKMIEWVAKTRQRVLQLLPVNDTTSTHDWTDSYPYNCISIFALHPQYADLTALPPLKDVKKRAAFEALRQELNALGQIDYVRVNDAKNAYLREIYAQEGEKTLSSAAFKAFFAKNERWLVPYAGYCLLRDEFGTADFSKWTGYESFDGKDCKELPSSHLKPHEDVAFYYYVQFVLASQLASAHEYARSNGVILKGDIPIGVSRFSCDVWQEPRYFNMSGQAGAPPDDFSVNGQNWGFPTYDWDEMKKDGCQWWVRRFKNMSEYFDAYRIDHVLGFFRIWEIPVHSVHGLLGQFSPSLGMTREEIEAYGLKFDERRFLEPFIDSHVLECMFGEEAETVAAEFMDKTSDDRYKLKDAFDTQRKICGYFKGKNGKGDVALRDRLYSLVSDVLFVRDHKTPGKFHPRIAVQHDFVYGALSDDDKFRFNRIYNDYYYRRNSQFWYREAMTKLPLLTESTRMLVCAEDLGMVPECVPWVLDGLKILSLEMPSMPKEEFVKFGNPDKYPYRSVCTLSSHDTPTLRQWWDEDAARTQEYYNTMIGKYGDAPHPLPGWLARDIILRHLKCPSMLCILSVQDWLAIDEGLRLADADAERINIPSNPRHYWRYRMHVPMERLLANNDFNQNITDLVREGGRS